MRLVLLGPPGSGKGTQARFLEDRFKACRLSAGDILRTEVSEKTPLGREAGAFIAKGQLVPDRLMENIIETRLAEGACARAFVLDGFPRNVAQANALEIMLRKLASSLQLVLYLRVPREVVLERLGGRRTCRDCGAMFHEKFDPPRRPGVCDRCRGELHQREDDREETILARLGVYEEETLPLAAYYRQRGLLHELDGVGTVEEVRARALKELGRFLPR